MKNIQRVSVLGSTMLDLGQTPMTIVKQLPDLLDQAKSRCDCGRVLDIGPIIRNRRARSGYVHGWCVGCRYPAFVVPVVVKSVPCRHRVRLLNEIVREVKVYLVTKAELGDGIDGRTYLNVKLIRDLNKQLDIDTKPWRPNTEWFGEVVQRVPIKRLREMVMVSVRENWMNRGELFETLCRLTLAALKVRDPDTYNGIYNILIGKHPQVE